MKKEDLVLSLTVRDIEKKALPPLSGAGVDRIEYRFKQCPGLILRVTKQGRKTFYVYKRIRDQKVPYRRKLGVYPELSPDVALELALADLEEVARGKDPRETKRANEPLKVTFAQLFKRYMDEYAKEHTKTWAETEKIYRRYFRSWDSRAVSTIRRIEVQSWVHKLAADAAGSRRSKDGTATANRCFDVLRAVMNWGIKMQVVKVEHDPCLGVRRYQKVERERFLMPHEWESFKAALESESNPVIRDFVWMCLLTGARSGNVMRMRWAEIDWDLATWTIPRSGGRKVTGQSTKNNDGQIVNLTPTAIEVLKECRQRTSGEWVFPGRSEGGRVSGAGHLVEPKDAWKRLLLRAGLYSEDRNKRLCIHDLRRTVGSYMAIQGVDTKTIGKALGHRSAASTMVYARLLQGPVRAALEDAQAAFGNTDKLLNRRGGQAVAITSTKKNSRATANGGR